MIIWGGIFEDICKQYLWKLLLHDKCAVNFYDIGRWWGSDIKTKSQVEIDILGVDKDTNTALFAECKWKNEKIDVSVLDTLIYRSSLFNYDKKYYYIFSKKGFTQGCINKAKAMANIELLTLDDMITKASELT